MPKQVTEQLIEEIRQRYGKMSYDEIALALSISKAQVASIRKKYIPSVYGIGKSPHSRSKVEHTCSEGFFSQPDVVSSYWAGLLAADGCIRRNENHTPRLTLALKGEDISHLEILKQDLKTDAKIWKSTTKYVKKDETLATSAVLTIANERIVKDLEEIYNVTQRKSLTLLPPRLESLGTKLAYIKGYIDGDGWIERPSRHWKSHVSFLGTMEVLTWIKEVLEIDLGLELPPKALHKKDAQKETNTWCITVTGSLARRLLKHLVDIPRGLKRKWEGVKEALDTYQDPRVKLSVEDVRKVLSRLQAGDKQEDIAKDFNVHQMTISIVKRRKAKWLRDSRYDQCYHFD